MQQILNKLSLHFPMQIAKITTEISFRAVIHARKIRIQICRNYQRNEWQSELSQ